MRVEHGHEVIVCIPTAFLLVFRYLMSSFVPLQWKGKVRPFKETSVFFYGLNYIY